jgi:hypothetical protein
MVLLAVQDVQAVQAYQLGNEKIWLVSSRVFACLFSCLLCLASHVSARCLARVLRHVSSACL